MASLTTDAPDPKTFQTWEDAFKYPIPSVRRMEQQLRSDVSGNRERLRTLVGTSYRELLGTAESIVQMDKQMKDAESYLSTISQTCNTRNLEKAQLSTSKIRQQSLARDLRVNAHASHLALLQQCPATIASLLKTGQSLQLAAKILALSRLLHKKASSDSSTASFVDKLRLRLLKVRMRLLAIADRRMSNSSLDANATVDAMAACSLATNCSCADLLRHFHLVRLGAISSCFQSEESAGGGAVKGLELWIRTMQDTQSLFPRQMSITLAKVKSKPILADESVLGIEDLGFETFGNFIDDDIRYFTPYVRHDDLNVSAAAEILSTWSPLALQRYTEGLRHQLSGIEDFSTLLTLRKDCLQLWISGKGRYVGVSKSEGLDILRKTFREVLNQRIKEQAESVMQIVEAIRTSLAGTTFVSQVPKSLWTDDLVNADLSNGAERLTDVVRTRVLGHSPQLDDVLRAYANWLTKMNSARAAIQDLRSKKWTFDELDDDEDDDEQNEDIEDMRYRSEQEDTRDLENNFQDGLMASIHALEVGVDEYCSELIDETSAGQKATFVLRALREIKQRPPEGVNSGDITFEVICKLQRTVAQPIVRGLIERQKSSIIAATRQIKVPVRLLWDGSPESPIVPSPWSFMLLKSLHQSMGGVGIDIWTTHAVGELQDVLQLGLIAVLESSEATNDVKSGTSITAKINGAEVGKEHSHDRDAKIQLLFDAEYIRVALSTHMTKKPGSLVSYCKSVIKESEMSGESSERIAMAANEYWKRTRLLFHLLA